MGPSVSPSSSHHWVIPLHEGLSLNLKTAVDFNIHVKEKKGADQAAVLFYQAEWLHSEDGCTTNQLECLESFAAHR